MTERKSGVAKRIDARMAWLAKGDVSAHARLTSHQRAAVLRLIEEGATLVELARYEGMPSVSAIYAESYADPQFASDLQAARAASACTVIEEAQSELRDALESNDPDKMRVAAAYHQGSIEYAAKIAPKEFGTLVKLAGSDGGALTVNLVDYAKVSLDVIGKAVESTKASREIEADFADIRDDYSGQAASP